MRGRSWKCRGALIALSVPLLVGAAQCDSTEQRSAFNLVNGDRRANGRAALAYSGELGLSADALADQLAAGAPFAHPPFSTWCDPAKYSRCTENLGKASSLTATHQALRASPSHWKNIIDPEVNVLGTGVAVSGGATYVVHRFARKR